MTPFRTASALAAALAAIALAACTTSAGSKEYFGKTEPLPGQQLRYVSGSEPESLDPALTTGQPEARIFQAIFEGLTELAPKTGQPIPGAAERWESNSDNTEFTFHLRPAARWSNGDPLTSDDFVYSIRRALTPSLGARASYMAWDILYAQPFNEGGVFVRDPHTGAFVDDPASPGHRLTLPGTAPERDKAIADGKLSDITAGKTFVPVRAEDIGVDAVDAHTVRLRLVRAIPFLPGLLGHQLFRPVPRKAVEQWGAAWTRPEHIITNGPFTVETWRPYDRLVVVRSPTYWDVANVRLEKITFIPLDDQTTILNLYKAGEIEGMLNHTVLSAWVDSMRSMKDYMDKPELANEYYQINTTRPPMNDRRVRKAFNMAIDKAALSHFKRTAKPLTSFVPEGIFDDYPRPSGDPFDAERAKALLVEAGYKDASGKYDPSKFPIRDVELIYNTTESNRQVAEFVQAQWKQNLQITVPIKNVEWKTFLDQRAKLDYKGFARSGWVGDYIDPYTFLNLFSTIAGDNGTGWWDKKFADMLNDANRETDSAKRYQVLANAEKILLDVQPVVPLYSNATNWLKKPYVKGMYPNPVTLHAWKYVYIEHDRSKWDDEPEAGSVP